MNPPSFKREKRGGSRQLQARLYDMRGFPTYDFSHGQTARRFAHLKKSCSDGIGMWAKAACPCQLALLTLKTTELKIQFPGDNQLGHIQHRYHHGFMHA